MSVQIVTQSFSKSAFEEMKKGRRIANATQGRATHIPNQSAVDEMDRLMAEHKKIPAPYATRSLAIPYYARQSAEAIAEYYGYSDNTKDIASALDSLENRIGFFVGAQQAYAIIIRAILQKHGSLNIFTQRGYPNYNLTIAEELRGDTKWQIFTLNEGETDYIGRPTIDELRYELKYAKGPTVLLLTNPSNPEGKFLGEDMHLELANLMRKYPELYVIFDESFIEMRLDIDNVHPAHLQPDFKYTGSDVSVAKRLGKEADLQSRIAILRSGSKAAGLASERLNLSILPDDETIIGNAEAILSRTIYAAPESLQAGMTGWLKAFHKAPEEMAGVNRPYIFSLQVISYTLAHSRIEMSMPQAGFFSIIDLSCLKGRRVPRSGNPKIDFDVIETDEQIAKLLLYLHPEKGLAVIPASSCHYKPEECKVRFCFGMVADDILLASRVIEFALNHTKEPSFSRTGR